MTSHADKQYEQELKNLKNLILKMGGIVEEMVAKSVQSLVDRDSRMAEETISRDKEVNVLEMEIDEACIEMLALRQPAASDLRFITIGLKISKDLERMGDLAVNISERVVEINQEPLLKPYEDIPLMAHQAQTMVKRSLDAFVKRDVAEAQKICEMDDLVDEAKKRIFAELVAMMEKDPQSVSRATRLISISYNLERVADHATNIAEEVIYMVQGRDIRHGMA